MTSNFTINLFHSALIYHPVQILINLQEFSLLTFLVFRSQYPRFHACINQLPIIRTCFHVMSMSYRRTVSCNRVRFAFRRLNAIVIYRRRTYTSPLISSAVCSYSICKSFKVELIPKRDLQHTSLKSNASSNLIYCLCDANVSSRCTGIVDSKQSNIVTSAIAGMMVVIVLQRTHPTRV